MSNQRQLLASVIVFVALLAPAAGPDNLFGTGAQAQPTDGKGPPELRRGGGPPRADQPGLPSQPAPPTISRSPAPTINRPPTPNFEARRDRQSQVLELGRDRIILRDGDRRRYDGDRRRGTRYSWGPGAEFFFFDGFYHGDCSWLRRKARDTGSRYWRVRYEQCRD